MRTFTLAGGCQCHPPDLKMGSPRCVSPPFLGLTPPTMRVPYLMACRGGAGGAPRCGRCPHPGRCAPACKLGPATYVQAAPAGPAQTSGSPGGAAACCYAPGPSPPCARAPPPPLHLVGVEGAVLARQPLADDLCGLVDKHRRVVRLRQPARGVWGWARGLAARLEEAGRPPPRLRTPPRCRGYPPLCGAHLAAKVAGAAGQQVVCRP